MIPDANLQCSVCWDDFKLDEDVRQLKCEHIFHENCIIPWLELHNTCPVCRQEQEPGSSENQPQQPPNSSSASGGSHEASTVGSGASQSSATLSSAGGWGPPQEQAQNQDLMDALGRSISVFNSLFG